MTAEQTQTRIDWNKLLDEALTAPGNLTGVYDRFWDYSFGNMMLFMMQGIHEPVASFSTWKSLGRHVILRLSRTLTVLDATRPPVEEGGGADEIQLALEVDAALGLHVLQLVDRREVLVGEDRIAERPEVLGRLQFGREGGQKEQVHVLRHAELRAGVPASAIEDEHDLFGRAGAGCTGKGGQLDLEEGDRDTGGQLPQRAARGGMDKADEVAPLIAVQHRRDRAFAVEAPDLLEDRL
jgi:hypothetical protein